jgi:hypothetical protein
MNPLDNPRALPKNLTDSKVMKAKSIAFSMLLLAHGGASGAAGIFDELIWTTTSTPFNFASATFYEVDSDFTNRFGAAEFDGANLGTIDLGQTLFLTGEQKSWKDNGTDVTSHTLFWAVTGTGGSGSGSLAYNWEANVGGNDQRWGAANAGNLTGNLLEGLGAGDYTLSVWTRITTNGVDAPGEIFNNRGGLNYNATFTIIPEPSAAMFGGLGMLALLRRRRV